MRDNAFIKSIRSEYNIVESSKRGLSWMPHDTHISIDIQGIDALFKGKSILVDTSEGYVSVSLRDDNEEFVEFDWITL